MHNNGTGKRQRRRYGKLQSIIWLPVFICLLYPLQLLSLDPDKAIGQYALDKWELSDGLPSNSIRAIAQTPDGFLWIGTGNTSNLSRFDGIAFRTNRAEIGQKIRNSRITGILADKHGELWLSSTDGFIRFQPKMGNFKHFPINGTPQDTWIYCILEDMTGTSWLGCNDGKLRSFKKESFTTFDTSGIGEKIMILSLLEDSKGNLWLGTDSAGLLKFQHGRLNKHPINGMSGKDVIFCLYEDRGGTLWLGTNKGLVRYDDTSVTAYTTRDGLSNNSIQDILQDHDGNMWVGTLSGINRLKTDSAGKIVIERHLENDLISCLFLDKEKSLWIGTNGSGLKRLRDCQFTTYTTEHGLNNNFIFSLYEDDNGSAWIGSCSGINCVNGKTPVELPPTFRLLENLVITAISRDKKGNLWIGTYGNGLFRLIGSRFVNYSEKSNFPGKYITTFYCTAEDNTWIGTENGLTLYHDGHFKSYPLPGNPHANTISFIHKSKRHRLWVGSYGGLHLLSSRDEEIDATDCQTFFKGIRINSIYEAPNGTLWFGTYGEGLIGLQIKADRNGIISKRSFSCREEHGLSSNNILQILADEEERLWMSSDSGIIKINRTDLDKFADGKTRNIDCVLYGISDGLKSHECTPSAIKTRTGELWFATKKGIAVCHPGKMRINKVPPPVIIEKVIVNDSHLSRDQRFYSFYDVQGMEFHVNAPTFISPEKVEFKIKLEGYDHRWRLLPAQGKRMVRYEDLSPGAYTFQAIACNSDGIWNRTGASFSFMIKRHFYQQTLFKILLFPAALALIIALHFFLKKYPITREPMKRYNYSTVSPGEAREYVKKLAHAMAVEHVYKDESLSLQSLAEKLGIPPKSLSQVINKELGKNYSNFVNEYRIEEAKELLYSHEKNDYSILEIAFEVGFNSKAVFNRAFKKVTGTTPSEYKKQSSADAN